MATETYDFTGEHFSFQSLQVGVNGKMQMSVLKSAEVSEDFEVKAIDDTNARQPIGRLPAKFKGGSLSLEFANIKYSQELIDTLGNGYMDVVLPITLILVAKGQKPITIAAGKCQVKKTGFSASGTDSISEKIEFILHEPVKRNGKSAIDT